MAVHVTFNMTLNFDRISPSIVLSVKHHILCHRFQVVVATICLILSSATAIWKLVCDNCCLII